MTSATSAAAVLGTLGINTHIDFNSYGYENLTNVENDINYLGVKIIRDSAQNPYDAQTWLQVAQATGAKFDDYIGENSPAGMQTDLGYVTQLAQEGILASIEGGNEEDDSYPASLGNTLAITAQFQQQVWTLGQSLGLPVINMSFGAGWSAANNWQGDYGAVGDLSAYANYANGHTYPLLGQLPDDTIQRMNGLTQLAASTRPPITTEIGWDVTVFDQPTIAKYVLDAVVDGIKDGDAGMYFYSMFDDNSGSWGLFNADGTPRPAATALHNLTTLLSDTGANAATFTPGSLNYMLTGAQTADNSLLIEKSDGSFWLSLWNETEAANSPHTVTVNLGTQAATVVEYDPLTGTSSTQSWSNVSSVQVSVPDHPVLLQIVPSTAGGTGASGTGSSGTGTSTGGTSGSGSTTTTASSSDLSITLPPAQTVAYGSTQTIAGVAINDAWAATASGTMTVNVWDNAGDSTVSLPGYAAASTLTISGTLTQINAALAGLAFTAGKAGNDSITIDAWNQAGVEKTQSFGVTVSVAPPVVTVPATESAVAGSTIAVAGVSVTDTYAASSAGTVTLNLGAGSGTIGIKNATGSSVTGLGSHAVTVTGTLAQINADLANLTYTAAGTSGSDSISVNVADQAGAQQTQAIAVTVTPAPPVVTVPGSESLTAGTTIAVTGASVTDPYAASSPGTMVLNLNAGSGTLGIKNAVGSSITGLGTHTVSVNGTLAQINADLANLSYTAGSSAGSDSISVNVWDQAGLSTTAAVSVAVVAAPVAATTTTTPTTTINIAANNANPVITASNANIVATAGNHSIFISGYNDTITAIGGTETVMAFIGGNKITTGAGNDNIQIGGTGNVVSAGGGTNVISDSGSGNTIVLPRGGAGSDGIYGYVLQNQDIFDLRTLLGGTTWNGSTATAGNYLTERTVNGTDAVFSVIPKGPAGGASYDVLTLHGSGPTSVATLLAHAIV